LRRNLDGQRVALAKAYGRPRRSAFAYRIGGIGGADINSHSVSPFKLLPNNFQKKYLHPKLSFKKYET
jgi:hypothetical protein